MSSIPARPSAPAPTRPPASASSSCSAEEAGEAHGPLTDLGTGSGVLAIAAAKLGWDPIEGYDHEVPALEAAASNAVANDVQLALQRANLRETLSAAAAYRRRQHDRPDPPSGGRAACERRRELPSPPLLLRRVPL